MRRRRSALLRHPPAPHAGPQSLAGAVPSRDPSPHARVSSMDSQPCLRRDGMTAMLRIPAPARDRARRSRNKDCRA